MWSSWCASWVPGLCPAAGHPRASPLLAAPAPGGEALSADSACLSAAVSSGANPVIHFLVGGWGGWGLREPLGAVLHRALMEEAQLEGERRRGGEGGRGGEGRGRRRSPPAPTRWESERRPALPGARPACRLRPQRPASRPAGVHLLPARTPPTHTARPGSHKGTRRGRWNAMVRGHIGFGACAGGRC